jgi:hypothetical protein
MLLEDFNAPRITGNDESPKHQRATAGTLYGVVQVDGVLLAEHV